MTKTHIALGVLAFSVSMVVATPNAVAAVLMGSVNTNPGVANVDLTATGDVDWAIWNFTNTGNNAGPIAPTNKMSGGAGLISSVTTAGDGTSLRGSGGGSIGLQNFSYTNGSSPSSLASAPQSLIFANPLNTDNVGIQLNITGNTGQTYYVNVWATGFLGQGTMTATLNGATSVALNSQTYAAVAPKAPTLFTFVFRPDNVNDKLNIQYLLTEPGGTSSHVGIQAITISTTPEPSMSLLGLTGLIGLVAIRRRPRVK